MSKGAEAIAAYVPLSSRSVCTKGPEESPTNLEEEEWILRQQLTGVVSRLVIYGVGEHPRHDILGLRSGGYQRIMVTSVREGGPASRAGVITGDELVSINGRKDFKHVPVDVIHASLRAPVTLVFVGFVGSLQAEVRLNRQDSELAGLPMKQSILGPEAGGQVQVLDAVVFQDVSAPLFLASGEEEVGDHSNNQALYELRREDAKELITRVQRTIGRELAGALLV